MVAEAIVGAILGACEYLPGAVPGAAPDVIFGALAAPFGDWLVTPEDMLDIEPPLEGVGAILPVVVPDCAIGAETAPLGAGEDIWVLCAQAIPVVNSKAVDANHSERMIVS